jgi:hypothetical protein
MMAVRTPAATATSIFKPDGAKTNAARIEAVTEP